jgi:hypothetical protein
LARHSRFFRIAVEEVRSEQASANNALYFLSATSVPADAKSSLRTSTIAMEIASRLAPHSSVRASVTRVASFRFYSSVRPFSMVIWT